MNPAYDGFHGIDVLDSWTIPARRLVPDFNSADRLVGRVRTYKCNFKERTEAQIGYWRAISITVMGGVP